MLSLTQGGSFLKKALILKRRNLLKGTSKLGMAGERNINATPDKFMLQVNLHKYFPSVSIQLSKNMNGVSTLSQA